MIPNIVASDRAKIKRTSLWMIIFLIPVCTLLFRYVDYLIRGNYHEKKVIQLGTDWWTYTLGGSSGILLFALPLAITMCCSVMANIEHQAAGWKQIFALPVSKSGVYLSKFLIVVAFMLLSSFLLGIGYVLMGFVLDFNETIPWSLIFKQAFFPTIAAFPIMAFQFWLSMVIKNQAFSIAIGSVMTISGLFMAISQLSFINWLPWTYPFRALPLQFGLNGFEMNSNLLSISLISLLVGTLLFIVGNKDFVRRDIY